MHIINDLWMCKLSKMSLAVVCSSVYKNIKQELFLI